MKKIRYYLWIYSLLFAALLMESCRESHTDTSKGQEKFPNSSQTKLINTNTASKDSLKPIAHVPCPELQLFVAEMEKLNWIPDTVRLVRQYGKRKFQYFNQYPFYPLSFQDSEIKRMSGINPSFELVVKPPSESNPDSLPSPKPITEPDETGSLDTALFARAQSIWAYFYRERNGTRDSKGKKWISDGVIEQWELANEQEAIWAFEQISRAGWDIYINTQPYFCLVRNNLIIFHTRAMAFSFDQKVLFEMFIQKNGKPSPH